MKSPEEVDQLLSSLTRYCRSITDSVWDAEDLVQDTCLKAMPVVTGRKGHPNAAAYLLRTAKHLAVDRARRRRLARRKLEEQRAESESAGFAPDLDAGSEIEHWLSSLVSRLSPLQLSVFLLRDVFGYSGSWTAQSLRTSEGAVKAALHRAREALRPLRESKRAPEETVDEGRQELLLVCLHAMRQWNPQAIVAYAMIQNGQAEAAQASVHAAGLAAGGARLAEGRSGGARQSGASLALAA